MIESYLLLVYIVQVLKIKMPMKKTVDGWNFSCVGYELDCEGNVTMIWCKICREFYEEMKNKATGSSGVGQIGNILFLTYCFQMKES